MRKLGHALITLCGCCGRSRAWRLNRPRTSLQSEALPHPVFPWTALPKERPPTRRASMHRATEIRARGCLGPSVVPAGVCARTFPSECIVLQGPPGQCLVVVSPWLVQSLLSPATHVTSLRKIQRSDRSNDGRVSAIFAPVTSSAFVVRLCPAQGHARRSKIGAEHHSGCHRVKLSFR